MHPFTNHNSHINNTQVDNTGYQDIVMPMHSLIEYNYNYVKTGSLWWYHKDIPNDNIEVSFSLFNVFSSSISTIIRYIYNYNAKILKKKETKQNKKKKQKQQQKQW